MAKAVTRALNLKTRKVIVLGVESHITWQDLVDGITTPWAHAGNEMADALAKRASTRASLPELDQERLRNVLWRASRVQWRIAFAACAAAAAVPPQTAPRGQEREIPKRNLLQALSEAGHALKAHGSHRWHCTRCRQSAIRPFRREWLAQGPCRPLVSNRPSLGRTVVVGSTFLHDYHALGWRDSESCWQ